MQVDYFKDLLVPVVGGLGIFMLGLEFMSSGIQSLAVNKMRARSSTLGSTLASSRSCLARLPGTSTRRRRRAAHRARAVRAESTGS